MIPTTEAPAEILDPLREALPRIEVSRQLTDAQVDAYMNDGFLIVDDVVTPDEISELCADMITILRGGYDCQGFEAAPEHLTDREVMESFSGIVQPHYISPVVLRYVKHAKICGMLSQLVGAHVPFWDGSIKCMQSMVFVKPPGFPGQAWHQDELYIPTRDRSLCGAWVALDDATVENGCLYVVPGSHRPGYLYPQRQHERPGEWDWAPESYTFDDSAAVPAEVKAGGAVFFNGYILHGSFKNRSQIYRRALVNHYMNSWSQLPWGAGSADNRCVVPAAGVDPYAWKGYETPSAKAVWSRPLKQAETSA